MRTFNRPRDFATFLRGLAATMPMAESRAIRGAGEVIQEEAVRSLGHYHDAAGPFGAWAPLSERTMRQREEHGLPPDEPLRATWELSTHIELSSQGWRAAVGVPHETVGDGSKANPFRDIGAVAVTMEFGSDRVPARPFLGRAAFVKGATAARAAGVIMGMAIASVPLDKRPASALANNIPF